MRHQNKALDKVRKGEYAQIAAEGRRHITGRKHTLLSIWGKLSVKWYEALELMSMACKRLNKVYMLKES